VTYMIGGVGALLGAGIVWFLLVKVEVIPGRCYHCGQRSFLRVRVRCGVAGDQWLCPSCATP
jgi:hypothetical protein